VIDVQRAAATVGRHPETVRRWIRSGRLPAHRQGNRLFVTRADVEAQVERSEPAVSLAEWAQLAREVRVDARARHKRRSAADLVLEDRAARSR